MRATLFLLAIATSVAADEADDYFDVGLGYLKTAFYVEARSAFAESLVRAPGQAVPTVFAGVASAAEGRDSRSCAYLLRLGYERLPARKAMRLDLRAVYRSAEDLRRVEARFELRLTSNRGRARDNLTILAFLQAQDGTPETSPALDALLEQYPADPFGLALMKLRPIAPQPGPDAQPGIGAGAQAPPEAPPDRAPNGANR